MVNIITNKLLSITSEDKYKQNTWLYLYDNSVCCVIDPNLEACAYIKKNALKPDIVFLTHGHFDHIVGLEILYNAYKCKIYCSSETQIALNDPQKNLSLYYLKPPISYNISNINTANIPYVYYHNETFNLTKLSGHSESDMVIFINNYLFVGDLIQFNKKTPLGLPGSSKTQLLNSLNFLYENYDENIIICPGHGKNFLKKEWNIEKSIS